MLRNSWPLSYMKRRSGGNPVGTGPYSATRWRIDIAETMSGSAWPTLTDVRFLDALGNNLCATIGGTASASATEGGGSPANALDGNGATRWSAGTATKPQWWEFTASAAISPNELEITMGNVGDSPKTFTLSYHDGVSFVVAKSVTAMPWHSVGQVARFPIGSTFSPAQAILWRLLHGNRQSTSAFSAWNELEFQDAGGTDLSTTAAFASNGTTAANAFDNNSATNYSSGASVDGSSVGCQLSSAAAIETVVAKASGTANDTIKSANVQYYNSERWLTYWSWHSYTNWTASETRTFARTDSYPIPRMFHTRTAYANNNNTATPPTVLMPQAADVGDIAFLQAVLNDTTDSQTIDTPSGWTQVDQQQIGGSGLQKHALFWKRLTLADLDSSVVLSCTGSFGAADHFSGHISVWRWALGSGTPYEALGNNSGTGTAMGGSAVTTTGANRRVIHFGGIVGQRLCSPAAGYLEEYDLQSSSGTLDGSIKCYSIDRASAGTEPAANHTLAASHAWQTMALGLIAA